MGLSTAFKISGVCLLALAAEALLAYLVFSNYAFELAEGGQYRTRELYSTGPMASLAVFFYWIFGVTVAVGVGAPLFAVVFLFFRGGKKPGQEG